MENQALVLDLLEWVGPSRRPYDEVMNAWRTSCPRLSIWEDALAAGLLEVAGEQVRVTPAGAQFLASRHRPTGGRPG